MVFTDRKWSLPDDMQTFFFLGILQNVYPMRRVELKLSGFTFTSLPKGGLRVPFGAFRGLGIGFAIRRWVARKPIAFRFKVVVGT